MGLVFPLQTNLRKSKPDALALVSTTKRFTVGSTFLFVGLVLITMHLAAAPLFKIMWEQGQFFDKVLTGFFYGIVVLFPFISLLCWFYQSKVTIQKSQDGNFNILTEKRLGPIKWNKNSYHLSNLDNLEIVNWKGALNMAAIQSQTAPKPDRYSTKGHWILRIKNQNQSSLEQRAKKEDIDDLINEIKYFFRPQ